MPTTDLNTDTPQATLWPAEHTAYLMIHGIGEQLRFEALDAFAAACWRVLEARNGGGEIAGKHVVTVEGEALYHAVLLARGDHDPAPVEFREYYWADKAERLVDLAAIGRWLLQVSEGARKYYDENETLAAHYAEDGVRAFAGRKFRRHWYLKYLGWAFRFLSLFPGSVVEWFLRWIPSMFFLLNPLLRWVRTELIGYIGDIVIYTSSDERSEFYLAREAILDGAVGAIANMLRDSHIQRIVVAGHSLGSVIAYDALNRINRAMNTGEIDPALARKFSGLVTFGSPLDKVAFFFREHTPRDEYLRRQILDHHHSFKSRTWDFDPNPRTLGSPFQRFLEHVRWINFWDRQDPISGALDFYAVDENVELAMGAGISRAHTAYLHHDAMVGRLIDGTIALPPPPGSPAA